MNKMRQKAIEPKEYTKATTWNTKDLQPGATLEGQYIKKEEFEGKYGPTEKYIIKNPAGELMGVYITTVLKRQFDTIPTGSYVWITYKGVTTSKNERPVKIYDVEVDREYQA